MVDYLGYLNRQPAVLPAAALSDDYGDAGLPGNLSIHLRKLEEAGYVSIDKSFVNRKPLTRVRMTPKGRKAFAAYLERVTISLREWGGST